MKDKNSSDKQPKVFISNRESKCDECGEELGRHAWIVLSENKGAACLTCADLDHLVFLPSGDTALKRRSRYGTRGCRRSITTLGIWEIVTSRFNKFLIQCSKIE